LSEFPLLEGDAASRPVRTNEVWMEWETYNREARGGEREKGKADQEKWSKYLWRM
jgi:hypothetical protein